MGLTNPSQGTGRRSLLCAASPGPLFLFALLGQGSRSCGVWHAEVGMPGPSARASGTLGPACPYPAYPYSYQDLILGPS